MKNDICVKNLSKSYANFQLKDLSFEVPEGSVVGFIGENGSGKTTTIKLLLNEIQKDQGSIEILGMDPVIDEVAVKKEIGVVLDDSFLSEYLTPKDINVIFNKIYDNWDSALYYQYLKEFSLPEKQIIKNLSTGMKMKLKIISALAHHPKILILDEPTSGLDPIVRNEILEIFRAFVEDGKHTIFISSHITSDLEHIADYIVFIHNGTLVLQCETSSLLENYGLVKCEEETFKNIASKDMICYLKEKYSYTVLVEDKRKFNQKYDVPMIDKPLIDDIMLLFVKGEKQK